MLNEVDLDRAIDDLLAGKTASDGRDEVAETIIALAGLEELRPPAAGKAGARQMMLARARELQERPTPSRWRQRLTAIMAAAVAMTMVSAGTVYAASGSAPGDILYPVKRASEDVSIAFKPPGISRAQAELDLARIRLAEIKILVNRGDTEHIGTLVRDLNETLAAAGSWRSRLTRLQQRQIETGSLGLKRAIENALRNRALKGRKHLKPLGKVILRRAIRRSVRENPVPAATSPIPALRTIKPRQTAPAAPAPQAPRPINRERRPLQQPPANPGKPSMPGNPGKRERPSTQTHGKVK